MDRRHAFDRLRKVCCESLRGPCRAALLYRKKYVTLISSRLSPKREPSTKWVQTSAVWCCRGLQVVCRCASIYYSGRSYAFRLYINMKTKRPLYSQTPKVVRGLPVFILRLLCSTYWCRTPRGTARSYDGGQALCSVDWSRFWLSLLLLAVCACV